MLFRSRYLSDHEFKTDIQPAKLIGTVKPCLIEPHDFDIDTMTIYQPDISGRTGPKYRAIAQAIGDDVALGHLSPGIRFI